MQHINKDINNFLRRGFVENTAGIGISNDPFHFAQDPTFLSFRVEFFFDTNTPSQGTSKKSFHADPHLIHTLSHNCLLRPGKYAIDASEKTTDNSPTNPVFLGKPDPSDYNFDDSAEDYLYAIGSVNRIGYLRSFKELLYKMQTETPWYFQKITGGENMYLLDPGVNLKKDQKLVFECLESVDMRTSMLADFYRLAAFDFERHREVLPYNMRTFSMRIHVMEMRNFNTTSGRIAQSLRGTPESKFIEEIKSSVVSGTPLTDSKSSVVWDAISMQTYELGLCEFDFYSQAPGYLEDLNVVDVPQATFKFGVNFGTVRKTGKYSFYRYLTDYVVRHSEFPITASPFPSINIGNPTVQNAFYDAEAAANFLSNYSKGGFSYCRWWHRWSHFSCKRKNGSIPSPITETERMKFQDEQTIANQNPNRGVGASKGNFATATTTNFANDANAGGLLGKVLGAAESALGSAVNRVVSRVNQAVLGNVYDNIPNPAEVEQALLGFVNPSLAPSFGAGAGTPSKDIPKNVDFDKLSVDTNINKSTLDKLPVDTELSTSSFDNLPVDTTLATDKFEPLSVDNTITKSSMEPLGAETTLIAVPMQTPPAPGVPDKSVDFQPAPSQPTISPRNVYRQS